jgi:5'(3')-deoxyribonucleotidase
MHILKEPGYFRRLECVLRISEGVTKTMILHSHMLGINVVHCIMSSKGQCGHDL